MKLKTENLEKVFRTDLVETVALNGVSIDVNDGEFVAVMGPSGCGKSTLLNILGLLDNPTSGSYRIDGVEVAQLKERERTLYRRGKIGFIFQSFNLIEEMTVEENIALPLTYLDYSSAERKKLVEEVMISLNIAHRAKHFPNQLSGGQQQRVAIARAVVTKPGLILADEPTGNLDSKNGRDVMTTLKALNDAGTTIVMVTHSQKDAQYANRVINLFDGLVVDSLKDKM
ncbi:MAG: ABC transporter ATP-binding protein [Bacteroidaceae bacterium]|nr:ABC transporter ATP-binding protein [Bacteroidaceae bacterium]MBR3616224.1 ABC transporter ATP-binding protein [Bacteroidaceae bacterium]